MRTVTGLPLLAAACLVLAMASSAAAMPSVDYETVLDGYFLSAGKGLTTDEAGNAFVIGRYIGDSTHNDFLVAKLDPQGDVLWTTEVAGDGHDVAEDLVLDASGRLLVTGWTASEDFPITPDAMDATLTGFRDVFLLMLSPVDGSILYGTFFGGDYTDEGHGIALNDAGDIYIVGTTGSTDFPTVNAYQNEPNAPLYIYTDVFITVLAPNAKAILYSTYFGGFEDDTGLRIGLDAAGNMIIAGGTNSDDFPVLDAVSSTPNEIFVSKLSADGSTLLYSTYFGGGDRDRLMSMAVDDGGHAYLAGTTRSIDLPTTPGAFQEYLIGEINGCQTYVPVDFFNCDDTFVTKMATDGTGLAYSTFVAGTEIEEARDIAVDALGRAHVVGWTGSSDFPGEPLDVSVVLYQLDANGAELGYTVFKESGSANADAAVAVGTSGDAYMTGSANVPADIYVAKISTGEEYTGVDDVVERMVLHQNSPNPFNPTTRIAFSLAETGPVNLSVYSASGRLVRVLIANEERTHGPHSVVWDGLDADGNAAASCATPAH